MTSFEESFWGDQDKGFEVLVGRMKQGKHICEEIVTLLKERASIEEEYSKKLGRLAKSFIVKEELGSLRDALEVLKSETEKSSRIHQDHAVDLRNKLEKPLQEFITSQTAIRKDHQKILEKDLSSKATQSNMVLRAKDRLDAKSAEVKTLQQQINSGTREMDRLRTRTERAVMATTQCDQEYFASVGKLGEIYRQWEANMRAACIDYQKLEESRFNFLNLTVWEYTNVLSRGYLLDDEGCEQIRQSLEKASFQDDLQLFIRHASTGTKIPAPLQYERVQGFEAPQSVDSVSDFSRSSQVQPFALGSFARAAEKDHHVNTSQQDADPYKVDDTVPIIGTVRVFYDYQAQSPEEMDIIKGQIIPVVATNEDGY